MMGEQWLHLVTVVCALAVIVTANENAPRFSEGLTRTTVSEGAGVGTVVFESIIVTDSDTDNPYLRVYCAEQDRGYNPCDYFELESKFVGSPQEWRGQLKLSRQLDYEVHKVYEVTIAANDSVSAQYQNYVVDVTNVQDVPPRFQGSLTGSVLEDAEINTEVLQVTAVDGDGLGASIRYTLLTNPEGFFKIVRDTGMICTATTLDREIPVVSQNDSSVQLKVLATELLADGSPGIGGRYMAIADVRISITDVNDNVPMFSPAMYQVNMEESLANGATILGLNIRVFDQDQGANAEFRLVLQDYTDIFEIRPQEGQGALAVSIVIKNSSQIDYDLGLRNYTLRILAEEKSGSGRSSEGIVVVNVEDVNDNPPIFRQPYYTVTIPETAYVPEHVITIEADDLDQSKYYGKNSIRYKCSGEGASNFKCDWRTGAITVARPKGCFKPGLANCLDAEVKNFYMLEVSATDAFAEGNTAVVPLNITITDVNDNRPFISVPEYISSIVEDEKIPNPEVTVKAEDGDRPDGQFGIIKYTIVGGQPTPDGLWDIDAITGFVQATRGVPYPPSGVYLLTVEASDATGLSDTAIVRIFVEDINNHSPIFTQDGMYIQTIPEDTPAGYNVENVTALDNDPINTANQRILYRIISGSRGKFDLHESSGALTVAPAAKFDYDKENMYNITVIAEDQGNPKRSALATVIIYILDANNKNPVLRPTTVRADVLESAPMGVPVVTVTAVDLDQNADLKYTIIEPFKAWNRVNQEIPDHPYQDWFKINQDSGLVTVNNNLDRDKVIRWSANIQVQDINGGPDQTAKGLLMITIIKVNDRPPIFAPPWTPENPVIDINVREGQADGSYITTLVASDASDGIDKYILLNNPSGFFDIDNTGVVTVAKPLDFEQQRSTQFVVVAVDAGQPSLSSTVTINVQIININDETPEFSQTQYEKSIMENSPEGFSILQVFATDKDDGDFGDVRYTLDDADKRFVINERTGWITVAPDAVLDREEQRLIAITAQAYDSPDDATVRKYISVPVYITLLDVDEFPPQFGQAIYRAVVPETSPPDTSVIQLTASDRDDSETNYIYLEMGGGDPKDLFRVDPDTGLVTTQRVLEDEAGVYNISVLVRNRDGANDNTNVAFVEITVLEMDNSPPMWIFPNPNNQTVQILENQPMGTNVVQVTARDSDVGINGMVGYSFDVNGEMVNKTDDFSINSITGVISAQREFDREQKHVYILTLVARDQGRPFGEAKQTLVINILDVEDNRPQFPIYTNCCSIPFYMKISEMSAAGAWVVTVKAQDKDLGESGRIMYSIEAGNEDGAFTIDADSGEIFLETTVDHERIDNYHLVVRASNPKPGPIRNPVSSKCIANCTDSSRVDLYINIIDHNEEPPAFSHQTYNACVSAKARFDTEVIKLTAIDPDKKSPEGVRYKIDSLLLVPGNNLIYSPKSFRIDSDEGMIYTNALMEMYEDNYFKLNIRASDANLTTQAALRIFVTETDKEVVVTLNEKKKSVEENLDYHIKSISEATGYSIVCINSIRFHVDVGGGGKVDVQRTDLYLHVIDPNSLRIVDPDYVRAGLAKISGAVVLASVSQWKGFIRDPVLITIIIVAVLLFIALLLLCCFCWCWGAIFKKRQKYVEAPIVLNAGTINPLWKGFEVQELSMKVPEAEAKLRAMSGYANAGYDQTETNTQQMSNGYMASHEEVHMTDSVATGPSTRIEAGLIGSSNTMMGSSSIGVSGAAVSMSTMTRAVQTDDMASTLNLSTEYLVPGSPSRIGATLTRSDWQGVHNSGYDYNGDADAYTTSDGRNVGIQTFQTSQQYSHSYHDDGAYPSPVDAGDNDYPDSFYQGEIHLGSLPPRSHQQASSQQQYQETQFSSSQEYHTTSYGEADGEIEYITF